ncbi:MAG: tRNA pseudouridine38-40 synthase [Chloroflexota bacterium]|nr:tRNA pseudouridine38-40 synthase [Chloroflexota bacterium]
MRTLRLDLAYEGTSFRGFAPQPGERTIGGVLEATLERVLGEPVRVTPGGRTDSGVHACGQVVSFATSNRMECSTLRRALNALVGDEILVTAVAEATETFDARRSARGRRYRYSIWNSPDRTIRERNWTTHIASPLDIDAMNEACGTLVGKHDFIAFQTHRAQDDVEKGTERTVRSASWERDLNEACLVRFDIEADGFLRHMVRTIVGSSILVGLGKERSTQLAFMLESRDRRDAGPTAPACGLTLVEVTY